MYCIFFLIVPSIVLFYITIFMTKPEMKVGVEFWLFGSVTRGLRVAPPENFVNSGCDLMYSVCIMGPFLVI